MAELDANLGRDIAEPSKDGEAPTRWFFSLGNTGSGFMSKGGCGFLKAKGVGAPYIVTRKISSMW